MMTSGCWQTLGTSDTGPELVVATSQSRAQGYSALDDKKFSVSGGGPRNLRGRCYLPSRLIACALLTLVRYTRFRRRAMCRA